MAMSGSTSEACKGPLPNFCFLASSASFFEVAFQSVMSCATPSSMCM